MSQVDEGPSHGLSRYQSRVWKCRCDVCKAGKAKAQRDYRNSPERGKLEHGTRSCYTAGCREEPCVKANRDYQREWMRLNRAGIPWSAMREEDDMLDSWDKEITDP